MLDPRGAASDEALDAAVRAAASLARALAQAGGCSVLLPGDRRPVELGETLAGWPHIHARLALIGAGAAARRWRSLAQRRGPIVFVSARMRARLPQALGPAHGATRILVVPGALADRHAAVRRRRLQRLRARPAARRRRRRARAAAGAAEPGMSTTTAPPRRSRAARPAAPGARAAAAPRTRRTPAPALLPAHVARLIGFVALAALGALQWAQMVRPAASDALLACVLASAAAGGALSARRAPRAAGARARRARRCSPRVVLLLVALAAAGVPLRFFGPRGWDDLAGGIGQGLGAVSTVRTPYGGLDEWTRIVIVLGGCALIGARGAAGVRAAPRRRVRRSRRPPPSRSARSTRVPVMQHDIRLPYLAGLLFALLLARVPVARARRAAQRRAAAALVAVAALAGYVAAPRARRRPRRCSTTRSSRSR